MSRRIPTLTSALAGLATLLAVHTAAIAEPIGSYFYLSPVGGYTIFDTDYRFPGLNPLADDLYVGGRLGYRFNPWLGFEVAGGFTPATEDVTAGKDVDFIHGTGDFVLSPFSGRWGAPFLLLGGGVNRYRVSDDDVKDGQGHASAGLGANFWLTDIVGLRVEARDLVWLLKDDVTNFETHTLIFSGGLTFALGARARDTDGDGVPDRKDNCPDTPAGATVDLAGCPGDADGDGVLNGLDQCDGTPAGATVDAKGCPSDTDGDGVLDGIDQCAATPKGATVDAKGCPIDSDGDGVFDGLDLCPDTSPGLKVDKDGCPIQVIERETELLDTGMIRLSDVNFETARAELLPESLPSLDVVGQVLSKWPELQIEIGGHTDARGSESYNQSLSEQRAQSVLDYLLGKFPNLKAEQLVARGYGESKPIASNGTAEGMARNRRVEFVVLNKDVLRREIERRRLLRLDENAPADTTGGE